jgi:hypothetical protein
MGIETAGGISGLDRIGNRQINGILRAGVAACAEIRDQRGNEA